VYLYNLFYDLPKHIILIDSARSGGDKEGWHPSTFLLD